MLAEAPVLLLDKAGAKRGAVPDSLPRLLRSPAEEDKGTLWRQRCSHDLHPRPNYPPRLHLRLLRAVHHAGPDMSLFLAKTVSGGRRAGMAAMLGAFTGCLVHTMLAALGLSALLAASATVFFVLKAAVRDAIGPLRGAEAPLLWPLLHRHQPAALCPSD